VSATDAAQFRAFHNSLQQQSFCALNRLENLMLVFRQLQNCSNVPTDRRRASSSSAVVRLYRPHMGNNNNKVFRFYIVRPLRPGKSHSHRSRKLLIASNSVLDGLVVPAIHILRVALKTPILLAILGMLRSDSSTTLFKSLVSACSSNSPETVFPDSFAFL
jgi:hypothetical protein